MDDDTRKERDFPLSAGILCGLGLGGFFDGILFVLGAAVASHAYQCL